MLIMPPEASSTNSKMKKHLNAWYGYVPDLPDQRDFKFLRTVGDLPNSVDLRGACPPVYNQGQLGSCTANAIGGAIEFDRMKQGLRDWPPSRLFIYYNERAMEGTIREDAGAMIRDGIKSVNKLGAPPESLWPYYIGKFARKPTARAYRAARAHRSLRYERVEQAWELLTAALALNELPVVFGFTVYESFESQTVAKSGIVRMPTTREQVVGGHAVCAVGYDNTKNVAICRNSWDVDWGMKGYFTLPREYITSFDLAADFWQIQTVK